jgi:hypothetical protein
LKDKTEISTLITLFSTKTALRKLIFAEKEPLKRVELILLVIEPIFKA